ncbi:MAG TPA: pyridoxamine 5'-phosphate oxidase family protein [Marmoricola sp.]|nr:pyridoxamine 5'-phosphate oxidase family protein [Marmoricola sp.]
MGRAYDRIGARLHDWLLAQPVFVVATAPGEGGHVNASPKGMAGTFAILDETTVAYLDYTGSGAETIAHLRDNGRITLMFMAFKGPPTIVRLQGTGRVVMHDEPEFAELRRLFSKPREIGQRGIVIVTCDRIADSCGYAVPLMDYVGDRDLLDRSQERRDDAYYEKYWAERNATSIDGLPALSERPVPHASA